MSGYLRALAYFRQDRTKIVILIGLIGLGTLLGLLQVWPLAILIDSLQGGSPRNATIWGLLPDGPVLQIALLAGATVLLRLLQEVVNLGRTLVNHRINYNGLCRVRCDLYRKLQELSLAYHKRRPQGDIIYRLSSDAFGCQVILNVLIGIGVAALTLIALTAILASRSAVLTMIAFSIAPLLVLTNIHFGRKFKARSLNAKQVESELTQGVQRSLSAMSLTQIFGREADEYDRFRCTIGKSAHAWLRLHRQEVFYSLIVGTLFGLGGALIFGLGGYFVYRDQTLNAEPSGLTMGDLMVFLGYLGMLYDPLCKLSGASASMQSGIAGMERVFEILDEETVIAEAPGASLLPIRPRVIRIEDAGFAYPDAEEGAAKRVLHAVNLTIEPGQVVAFMGASGVGKSTLLALLPRLYDPTHGALMLDHFDARQVKLRDWRRHFALVSQESILLPVSVAENIAYGRPEASAAEIRAAARLAGADEFIANLADGYETILSEAGQNLSGGQRQRIAIARALLTEAPIIVLDEPTSALDAEQERYITETLHMLRGHRTVVIVSHRLSTVMGCDRIFVLDEGRLVERGTHQELLVQRGVYYGMARHQLALEQAPIDSHAAWETAGKC